MSSAVAVRVSEGTSLPPKPQYSGIVQIAEVQAQLNGDALTFTLSNPGYGYVSPPKVVIDNFGTGGTGASFSILQSDIDSLTGEIKNIQSASGGSGYTSLPQIRLEGGFPFIEASGVPERLLLLVQYAPTSPDDAGNRRDPPGLTSNSSFIKRVLDIFNLLMFLSLIQLLREQKLLQPNGTCC